MSETFPCNVKDCDWISKTLSNLRKHETVHPIYHCNIEDCNYSFHSQNNLTNHIQSHY